ncbi:MAG TPA: hypothetical protein VF350_08235 [Candidatus Bathyarchaeia archaeon]
MTLIWMKAQSYPDGNVWEILYYRRSIGFPGEKKENLLDVAFFIF